METCSNYRIGVNLQYQALTLVEGFEPADSINNVGSPARVKLVVLRQPTGSEKGAEHVDCGASVRSDPFSPGAGFTVRPAPCLVIEIESAN